MVLILSLSHCHTMSTAKVQAVNAQAVNARARAQAQINAPVQALLHPNQLQVQKQYALLIKCASPDCGETENLVTTSTCGRLCTGCYRQMKGWD